MDTIKKIKIVNGITSIIIKQESLDKQVRNNNNINNNEHR